MCAAGGVNPSFSLIDTLAHGGGGLAPYLTSNPPIAYSVQCPGWVLAGAAQPSDFTSAAPTFPVPGVDNVGGSTRYVYPPTLIESFVPTPATPTSTAATTSLPRATRVESHDPPPLHNVGGRGGVAKTALHPGRPPIL